MSHDSTRVGLNFKDHASSKTPTVTTVTPIQTPYTTGGNTEEINVFLDSDFNRGWSPSPSPYQSGTVDALINLDGFTDTEVPHMPSERSVQPLTPPKPSAKPLVPGVRIPVPAAAPALRRPTPAPSGGPAATMGE